MEISRRTREKEWQAFVQEIEDKKAKVDEAFNQKEKDLFKNYADLEKKLQEEV